MVSPVIGLSHAQVLIIRVHPPPLPTLPMAPFNNVLGDQICDVCISNGSELLSQPQT